ncbi:GAF domain-containing protein [Actinomadura sp. KC345]|uniref:GAF domain-containing protein n=1 Tax=Actinomadura sp. KC345 TaxID=2530371 RepID=UPI0010477ABA|nr:GAF domain-containing protein [Actinomadura sp. KC345]TDC45323.1 GAF domain-containing protein [Actinomadura sp. KC345]
MERRSVRLVSHSASDPSEPASPLLAVDDVAHGHAGDGTGKPATPQRLRHAVVESWRRSREAGVAVEVPGAPEVCGPDEVAEARDGHRLNSLLPMLQEIIGRFTDDNAHVMVVTDGDGLALWRQGAPGLLTAADRIGMREGCCWSERSVGTNGIGTALATGAPQYVFAAEHLASCLHPWSCAGAPISDPDTGQVIGCVDVSATARELHPAAVTLVGAAARLAEGQLEMEMRCRDERMRERYRPHLEALDADRSGRGGRGGGTGLLVTPTGRVLLAEPASWTGRRLQVPTPGGHLRLPDGRQALAEPLGEVFLLHPFLSGSRRPRGNSSSRRPESQEDHRAQETGGTGHPPPLMLTLLGDDPPTARLRGRRITLSLRHAEILALLALHPRGLNGDRLSLHLYGEEGKPVTVRAEIHRLRAQLGEVVHAKPYRLACAVDADFLAVRRLLERGEVTAAARLARGELLPPSEAPIIRAERDELTMLLRLRVLERGDTAALWAYAQAEPGRDDLEVLEHLAAVLPPGDPRHAAVIAHAHRLLNETD